MKTKDIYDIFDKEIKKKFKSRARFALFLGTKRSVVQFYMDKLKDGTGIKMKSLLKLCDALGYEIVIKKKKAK